MSYITEPTPAEEAAARAKEAEEQAALPYKWTQQIGDLDITVEVPGNLKGKDFVVDIKKKKLVLGIKGQEPIISVGAPFPPRRRNAHIIDAG
jgi:HSP20 family molecular chaperone IbpA